MRTFYGSIGKNLNVMRPCKFSLLSLAACWGETKMNEILQSVFKFQHCLSLPNVIKLDKQVFRNVSRTKFLTRKAIAGLYINASVLLHTSTRLKTQFM